MIRILLVLVIASGCKSRAIEAPEPCPTWKADVSALLAERCAGCHGGASPAAGYDVTQYATAIDRDSLGKLATVFADDTHRPLADALPVMTRWSGECQVAFASFHAAGILDPQNAQDFHGHLVESMGWRLGECARCHGGDFSGGTSKVACTSCHAGGPTACTTCHGQPPATGSHLPHATAGVACGECHQVPTTYDAPGHPAAPGQQVVFGPLASRATTPQWEAATRTCAAIYCHGTTLGDAAATLTRPMWGVAEHGACGTCHGTPPASHATAAPCVSCHFKVVDAVGAIVNPARHSDGVVDVGDGTGTCTSCHGNPSAPLGGAHDGHVNGTRRLRGPVTCSECHVTPSVVNSPGHIDTGPPAEITFGALARADGANPAWDVSAKTCSGTGCHGGGTRLAGDTAPGLLRTPSWSGSTDQAACGTCHGVPPGDALHVATLTLADCAQCHAATVDRFGNIRIDSGTSTHMNGQVDANTP